MELIDKQKLLEYHRERIEDWKQFRKTYKDGSHSLQEACEIRIDAHQVEINLIESGTFDDHSAQQEIEKYRTEAMNERELSASIVAEREETIIECERLREEIAKLKEELKRSRLLSEGRERERVAARNRAIQAEKERDARYEFDKQRTIRLEEERNALLEGLKEIGRLSRDGLDTGMPKQALRQIDSIARSIIAKIESATK